MLFVFTDGTTASLATFPIVSNRGYLFSPDGGYVIYTAKTEDGREGLHLIDSSGATRPYGDSAEVVRALGWLPDSNFFVFASENPRQTYFGDVLGGVPNELSLDLYAKTVWVDEQHFLGSQEGNLYYVDLLEGRILLAEDVSDFCLK